MMLDKFGDSVGFPDAEDEGPSVDHGRLAGLLLRLHAQRWSGRAYVTAHGRTVTFAFRDGIPVMIEASTPEASLADDWVGRGLITRDEASDVIARVTEELVENEEVAFCEHAVMCGYITREDARAELSERIRTRLIQSLALTECEVELDESEESMIGVVEYPQKLGAAVYMGVRTFYEEEALRGYVPDLERNYVRLVKAPAEIARFFELDFEEIALLNSIDPQVHAASWFRQSDLESSHALQLIALLVVGRMCEVSTNAFVPPEAERSGVRSAARPASRQAMSAIREEVVEPRTRSRASIPAAKPRNDGSGAWDRSTTAVDMPAYDSTKPEPSPEVVVDAAAEALAEARARVAREKRGGGYAAHRVPHPSETNRQPARPARQEEPAPAAAPPARRVQQSAPLSPPSATPQQPATAVTPEYQKAHLKELWNRRLTGAHSGDVPVQPKAAPAPTLRQAQESLRDGQFARAEEQLRALVEQSPANDTLRVYHLWAKSRAGQTLDSSQLVSLRDLAKKLVSDGEHAGFACYVLAHLYLAEKKDDQAEKYFRKAHHIDKTNKDAERHIVILERRKQQATESDTGNQRKLFGFSFSKGGGKGE
jgi:tetratricopeptide (TPR) repeat protein